MTTGRSSTAELSTVEQAVESEATTVTGRSARIEMTVGTVKGRSALVTLSTPGQLIVDAGHDQYVEPYVTCKLTATVSGGGGSATFKWVQLAGPTVTLVNSTSRVASFSPPGTLDGTAVAFGVTATEGGYAPSPQATTTVNVAGATERMYLADGSQVPIRVQLVEA